MRKVWWDCKSAQYINRNSSLSRRPCQVSQYRQWVWRCPRYAAPVSTPLHCAAVNCSIKVSHQENYSQCNKTLYLDNKQTRGWHVVAQDVNVILFAIPMVKCKVMWCYKLWRWSKVQLCPLQCSCSTKQRQGQCAVIGRNQAVQCCSCKPCLRMQFAVEIKVCKVTVNLQWCQLN